MADQQGVLYSVDKDVTSIFMVIEKIFVMIETLLKKFNLITELKLIHLLRSLLNDEFLKII